MSSTATLRLVEIDELSDVRYIHATAVKALASGQLSEPEIDAFVANVYSEPYTERLAEMVRARRLFGVTVEGKLTTTAGWTPANDSGATARLMAVFVAPMFAGVGLGRLATNAAEDDALQAGFGAAAVRTPVGTAGFFTQLGYEVSSYGVWTLRPKCTLQVAFMRRALSRGNGVDSRGPDGFMEPN
jgi:GNAT superfamily N-acetyltransferase